VVSRSADLARNPPTSPVTRRDLTSRLARCRIAD
jgi:hypothetical protein